MIPPSTQPAESVGRKWLAAIICAYMALCLLYNLATPIGEGPDEPDHIRYIEYLVRYGSFPPISSGSSARPYTIQAKQPPAYYLIGAGLLLAMGRSGQSLAPELVENPRFSREDANYLKFDHPPVPPDLAPWTYILRSIGMILGVGTILFTFATVREVFPRPDEVPLAVGAAGIVGLLPQFTFLSSVVNNDHLAALVGAATSYVMVRILMRGVTWRLALTLGVMLGLSLLSKANSFLYLPIGFLVLALPGLPHVSLRSGWRDTGRAWLGFLRQRVPMLVAAVAICIAVGGWWMLRNLLVYGDVLARNAVNQMAAQSIPEQIVGANISDPAVLTNQLSGVTITHFATFGWVVITLPVMWYMLYTTLLVLSIVGLAIEPFRKELTWRQVSCLILAVLVFEIFYASMIFQVVWQGRLLFPVLALTSLLIMRGTSSWLRLVTRGRPAHIPAAAFWIIFLAAANITALVTVLIPAFSGNS